VVPLLEHLEARAIGVMGWSEGGQYALAAAFELGARVSRCAVIAGCPPLSDAATAGQLNHLDRAFSQLARRAPVALRLVGSVLHALSRHAPGVLLRSAVRGMPDAEAEAVRALGRWFPDIMGDGAANPHGLVDEYRALTAPWGFRPEDVTTPVAVFQGTADTLVPEPWGRALAERIPDATLRLYPGEGHFIALTRRRDVLEWLAGSWGREGPAGT
jgi:pimeloyl-ACP methyl ester carboxylesterase